MRLLRGGRLKVKYKLIKEDVLNAYILDTETNYVVTLCHTKRPDLGFKELQILIDKANERASLKPTIEDEFHWVTIKCPNCEEKLGISKMGKDDLFEELRFYKYCYNCGIKLDWEG